MSYAYLFKYIIIGDTGKKYELKGVEVHKEEDGYFLLECKYFKVIYQDFI